MKRAFKVLGTIVLIFFVTFFSYGCKEKLKTSRKGQSYNSFKGKPKSRYT